MQKHAFSLVELSIVLVILGLLVGGVLSGQSLIRASELRAVASEYNRYQTALGAFRDKYFYLPGDMPNAVSFWGAAAGGTATGPDSTCVALLTPSTDQKTCNGNGDGKIGPGLGATPNFYGPKSEIFRLWQQLTNAGLIEGSYTGVSTGDDPSVGLLLFAIGVNSPRSKLSNAGWTLYYSDALAPGGSGANAAWSDSNTAGWYYPSQWGNVLYFGGIGLWNISMRGGAITPEEAWNIDTKLDDGNPITGNVMGDTPTDSGYHASGQCSDDNYILTVTTPTCSLAFRTGY